MIIVVRDIIVEEPPVEPPPVHPVRGIGMALIGVDGVRWAIDQGPLAVAMSGVIGLGNPEEEHHWGESILDGAAWRGARTLPREVTLPLLLEVDPDPDTTQTFRALIAAWDTSTAGEVTWVVTVPNGRFRTLVMRRTDTGDLDGYEIDPLLERRLERTMKFVAGDPWWRGEAIGKSFTVETEPDFFPGPPYYIGSSDTTGQAAIRNPGDVPVWPIYEVRGPADGFTAGVGDNLIVYDAAIATSSDTDRIIVDTDPRRQTVLTGTGADAWAGVIERNFAPIPPGTDVALAVALDGSEAGAKIDVTLVPGYRSVW